MNQQTSIFATCPRGVEDLLVIECEQQGLSDIDPVRGGVACRGGIEQAYRLCLWSRVASRVLLRLHAFPLADQLQLYQGVQQVEWAQHLDPGGSFAIDAKTMHPEIRNSQFARLKIKDAIVDQFRQQFDKRPDVRLDRPDVRVNAFIDRRECSLYLDLSGEALHQRGYRKSAGVAPLKENLAAAVLLRSRWPELASEGRPLIDPLCGSATLLIEAAYIAADMAPGLLRSYYGFSNWKQHDPALWQSIHDEAGARVDRSRVPRMIGIEKSYKVAGIARANVRAAGFEDSIEIRQADSVDVISDRSETGLIVANPPYGKRIGENSGLKQLYHELGTSLKRGFPGWDVSLLTASHELARFFGLRAHHRNTLYNGPIKCTLYRYHIRDSAAPAPSSSGDAKTDTAEEALMFKNRLQKNLKHLSKWARKEGISCYRVYDADIPQFAIAIDIYEGRVHVQEYQAPRTVNAVRAFFRLDEAVKMIGDVLKVDEDSIVLKTRKRQGGAEQYTRQGDAADTLVVNESGLKFKINLGEYIDTGLFLDHRLTRQLIARIARDKSFLNLFAYTGSATVYAAAGGASSTTSVDMSNTYLAWAQENLALNGLASSRHAFIREDCIRWMADAAESESRYQVIFLDPPTFSNSKRMQQTLDIRRDHVALIRQAMDLLADDGVLIFSCNAQGFRLDEKQLNDYALADITSQTTTVDFRRRPAHVCWCLARHHENLQVCSF